MTPLPAKGPIESKVWAALIGAGSGTVISTFLLWLMGAAFWTGDWSNQGADNAILAVPSPLSALVLALVAPGLTFLGGYLAKHTPRNDMQAPGTEPEPRIYDDAGDESMYDH